MDFLLDFIIFMSMRTRDVKDAFFFSCRRATIHIPLSVSQSVSGHNSASAGARKLKFGMKDACSRISRPFFHFFKFPIF